LPAQAPVDGDGVEAYLGKGLVVDKLARMPPYGLEDAEVGFAAVGFDGRTLGREGSVFCAREVFDLKFALFP